jgi:hypothetical protein
MISIFLGKAGVSRTGPRDRAEESCWRRGGDRLSLATGPQSSPAATKESLMYLQPLLARVLIATVSMLAVLVGITAVH